MVLNFNLDVLMGIIWSIVGAALYEILKKGWSILADIHATKIRSFSLNGYWMSHVGVEEQNGKQYEGNEIIKISSDNERVTIKLYHVTSDGRKYEYIGYGFIRGTKLMFVYTEKGNEVSNQLGMCSFRVSNILEHSVTLRGNYFEYRKDKKFVKKFPYTLQPIHMKYKDRILARFSGKKHIWKLIENKTYIGNSFADK